jgi:hypothetical protein
MFSLKYKSISNFVFCRRRCWLPNSSCTVTTDISTNITVQPIVPQGYINKQAPGYAKFRLSGYMNYKEEAMAYMFLVSMFVTCKTGGDHYILFQAT